MVLLFTLQLLLGKFYYKDGRVQHPFQICISADIYFGPYLHYSAETKDHYYQKII